MKPIKLTAQNFPKIQAALDVANGKATAHTIISASYVQSIADDIKKQLLRLLLTRTWLPGATAEYVSGSSVSSAYKYGRDGTGVSFLFKSGGVFVTRVYRTSVPAKGGYTRIALTPEQDGRAIDVLRTEYRVLGGVEHWVGPTGAITQWGVFDDEGPAQAAFALVSGGGCEKD